MNNKIFKYQKYLNKYSNCPSSKCTEKNIQCYRWVHKPATEFDFYPIQLHPTFPPRKFDSSDEECISYGLSLYKTLEAARSNYLTQYHKRSSKSQKEKFIQIKGESIAELNIRESDGVHSEPNNNGHFTFYQYSECILSNTINNIFDNFDKDGNN